MLLDSFNRVHNYLRISLTDRCNLRCKYCMPNQHTKFKDPKLLLEREEIIKLANIFVDLGIKKLRLTGGEPLLRDDLIEIIRDLRLNPQLEKIALTSNATLLDKYAMELKLAGLDTLNISLDSLDEEKFNYISQSNSLNKVLAGIDSALNAKISRIKLNVVMIRGFNDDEVFNFIDFAAKKNLNLRFIEFMPFSGNEWDLSKVVPSAELKKLIQRKFTLTERIFLDSDVSEDFTIKETGQEIGFISSMTESFCSTCSRIRLTENGNLKPCLFNSKEYSLIKPLRAGQPESLIKNIIKSAILKKDFEHVQAAELVKQRNRPMISIGG